MGQHQSTRRERVIRTVDKSKEAGFHFYAYHGTDMEGRHGIIGWGILPPEIRESPSGMMGRGVYCTTSLDKAKCFGRHVLMLRFTPSNITYYQSKEDEADDCTKICRILLGIERNKNMLEACGIKVATKADPHGNWRYQGFNGVYVPAGTAAKRDEFCIKKEIIDKIVQRNCIFNCVMTDKIGQTKAIVRKYAKSLKKTKDYEDNPLLGLLVLIILYIIFFR